MSQLIDKLKKLSQTAPTPMGFRTSQSAEAVAPLLIIGRTALKAPVSQVKSNIQADAVLLKAGKSSLTAASVQKTVKAFGDMPWGVYLEEGGESATALVGAGCDFVVFASTARITDLPQDEKTGRIVQVDSSVDNGLLRAINDLPVDAVLVTDTLEKNDRLVWHHLMIYRHLANFITKPLIVPVTASITEGELKALQDAEIDGVMVDVDIASGETLDKLRKTISKLPARAMKKRDRTGVLLPRTSSESRPMTPPDEEEEEE